MVIVYVLAGVTFVKATAEGNSAVNNERAALRKTSSDYFGLAERAKKVRIVDLPTARTLYELQDLFMGLTRLKADADQRFHPSAKALSKARIDVRDQLVTEMDPERLIDEPQGEADRLRAG